MIDKCPESVIGVHSPANANGRCSWCGGQAERPVPRPECEPFELSALTEAYGRHYDPDYGALTPEQIRHRYRQGQDV